MQIKDRQIQLCPLLLSRKDFFLSYTDNFFISPALGLHKYVYMLTFISRFPFLKSIFNLLPNFKKLFIYFWLHWVFIAVHWLSLVAASRGDCSLRCVGFSLWQQQLLLLQSMNSRQWAQECGAWAQLLLGLWSLPGPRIEPVSPVFAGTSLTTGPSGKPPSRFNVWNQHIKIDARGIINLATPELQFSSLTFDVTHLLPCDQCCAELC